MFTIVTPRLRLTALALLIVAPWPAHTQPGPTFAQALRRAAHVSAATQAAQAAEDAAAQTAARAGQLPDPMLKIGIDNLPVSGPDRFTTSGEPMTMRRIGIEQQWVSADKRQARATRATRAVAAEQAATRQTAAQVREEAGKAWLDLFHAQRAAELASQLADEMRRDLAGVQAAHRGAKAGAADVLQARMALAQAEDDAAGAEQERRTAAVRLARWLQEPVDTVDGAPPAYTAAPAAAGTALQRPAVLAARRAIDLADADTAVATRERHPDWTFEAGFGQRSSRYGNMVSFGISVPLTVDRAQRQDRDVAEKSALGTRARLLYDDTLQAQEAQVRQLSEELDSLNTRIARLEAGLLPAAAEQVELAVAAYRSGAGSLSAVFQARRALLEKRLQINMLARQAGATWAALVLPANDEGDAQ
ncbi:outer membrane protein TolC [Pseudoduganella flava]|nr:TolC family protein [Pseudoduganella flava]TWI44929.1 outer membrane protein TolC [Pseudoduganella flava]